MGYDNLRRGEGDRTSVLELQRLLNQAGAYPRLVEDGTFGAMTEAEVLHFQWVHQLPTSGVVDAQTWALLSALPPFPPDPPANRPMLRVGSTHAAVAEMQARLTIKGATPPITIDGVFNSQTLEAVKQFQWQMNLPVTGMVDPATWAKLMDGPLPLTGQRPWLQIRSEAMPKTVDRDPAHAEPSVHSVATEGDLVTSEVMAAGLMATVTEQTLDELASASTTGALEPIYPTGGLFREYPPIHQHPRLRQGDREPSALGTGTIHRLQQVLKRTIAPHLRIDGDFGTETAAAVTAFQQASGLLPTGEVDPQTWVVLLETFTHKRTITQPQRIVPRRSPPPGKRFRLQFPYWRGPRTPTGLPYLTPNSIEPPQSNGPIHALQQLLHDCGYTNLDKPGHFGKKTLTSVQQFQMHQGLITTNGTIGTETWERLLAIVNGAAATPDPLQSITLASLCQYYDPQNTPHQTAALLWLQSRIPEETFNAFLAYWRNPS